MWPLLTVPLAKGASTDPLIPTPLALAVVAWYRLMRIC
jgi:hypothetical protein